MIYEIRWDRQRSNYTRIDEIESDKTNEASIRKQARRSDKDAQYEKVLGNLLKVWKNH